jgi:uncharacterized protein YyaL (SSP411 family)
MRKSLKFIVPLIALLLVVTSAMMRKANVLQLVGENGIEHFAAIPSVYEDSSTKADKINWLDFETGYATAVKEKKMLMVDAYTDWCGWCKVMDRNTFSNDTVIRKLNKDFVMVKLNPEKDRTYTFGDTMMTGVQVHQWLGYGKTFGYPTTYALVQPGVTDERVFSIGYLDPQEFQKFLDFILAKRK